MSDASRPALRTFTLFLVATLVARPDLHTAVLQRSMSVLRTVEPSELAVLPTTSPRPLSWASSGAERRHFLACLQSCAQADGSATDPCTVSVSLALLFVMIVVTPPCTRIPSAATIWRAA